MYCFMNQAIRNKPPERDYYINKDEGDANNNAIAAELGTKKYNLYNYITDKGGNTDTAIYIITNFTDEEIFNLKKLIDLGVNPDDAFLAIMHSDYTPIEKLINLGMKPDDVSRIIADIDYIHIEELLEIIEREGYTNYNDTINKLFNPNNPYDSQEYVHPYYENSW